jgi:endonuclease/exonuclease/phosphatase family metal-dependent hydrolase
MQIRNLLSSILIGILTAGLVLGLLLPALSEANVAATNAASYPSVSDSHLLEIGHAAKIQAGPPSPSEIKVVSYNIRWRGGEDLRQLAQLLKHDAEIGGAAILGLQEVDRNRKRTGNKNTVKALADELGMYYAWAAPPTPRGEKEEETGVAILSSYPLSQVHRIVLPHEGPGKRRRVALGATIKAGTTALRVYSVHSENRMAVTKKLEQSKAVLADLAHYPKDMPAMILGDLNTWESSAVAQTTQLFKDEGFHTPFDTRSTFSTKILFVNIAFKLDWIWLRKLQHNSHGIDREIELSDHWPLWLTIGMKATSANSVPLLN